MKNLGTQGGYNTQNDLVIGKLTTAIHYNCHNPPEDEAEFLSDNEELKEVIFEKETQVERTIPKKGFVNFKFEGINDLKKGLDYIA